ncbi:OPRL1 [Mytilus coruscus]|uniref:OPRL1 n=1 Tax=Mytilus coruscus TaxID=42192 RepID=A0A6J8D1B6_MYTCO|nr:OPRL1 [Mytilus coruscus]
MGGYGIGGNLSSLVVIFNSTPEIIALNMTDVLGPCDDATDEYSGFYNVAQFITGLIIYPIVCILGIIGNTLTLIVLSHKDMATSTNVYLSALAVSDTIKLINDFFYFIMVVLQDQNLDKDMRLISNFYPYAHYIFNMSVCVTAWLTVSVAVERYISICHITKAKEMCTITKARIVSTVVFLTMIILTVPSALRYEAIHQVDNNKNVTCYTVLPSALGNNSDFMDPYTWVQNSLRSIIPLIVLIFLNARIINELRKQRVKGKKLSSRNRITLMLIAIIIFFTVCIMPDAFMSLFFGFGYVDESNLVKGIREITDSLLAINSAFNFVLYCSMSKIFRTTFSKIFLTRCLAPKPSQERLLNNGTCIEKEAKSVNRKDSSSGSGNNNKETFV